MGITLKGKDPAEKDIMTEDPVRGLVD